MLREKMDLKVLTYFVQGLLDQGDEYHSEWYVLTEDHPSAKSIRKLEEKGGFDKHVIAELGTQLQASLFGHRDPAPSIGSIYRVREIFWDSPIMCGDSLNVGLDKIFSFYRGGEPIDPRIFRRT